MVANSQSSVDVNSIGQAGWGCLVGLLLGLLGGGLLLFLLALGWALTTTVPPVTAAPNVTPDLRLTLSESFLERIIQTAIAETVNLDILPGNQFRLQLDTTLSAFGVAVPIQITGLFGLQLVDQAITVQLIDTQLLGFDLPPELANFFNHNLPAINRDVNQAWQELSTVLNMPLFLTGLGSDETKLWLEARAAP